MPSWKKYLVAVPSAQSLNSKLQKSMAEFNSQNATGVSGSKFANFLPQVYTGPNNRVERYAQYYIMDQDSEVAQALDTIAAFCTQTTAQDSLPFDLNFDNDASETEVKIAKEALKQWCRINQFNRRIWKMLRNTFLYGDQFYIRDPETLKWEWIDHTKVKMIIVDEANGKKPAQYVINDLDLNTQTLVATSTTQPNDTYPAGLNTNQLMGIQSPQIVSLAPITGTLNRANGPYDNGPNANSVDAKFIIHLSLSEGMDSSWPFGTSILESVYKVFKQKELLEDAVIIYRVQRAPERRVFYIDVGDMPAHKAQAHVERIKNELHQKRIPNRTGTGANIMDAAYAPMSILEDYFLPVTTSGRSSKIDTLPGGQCLDLNTEIKLLDGRDVSLKTLIKEFEEGKQNWVYSCNPETGKIVPGKIDWAGVTRKNTQVVRLTLDSGEYVDVTPDHKFPILGKGDIEAQNLEIGESFIPLYTREGSIGNNKEVEKGSGYTQFFDNESKEWIFTHRMVAQYFKGMLVNETLYNDRHKDDKKNIVHHINFDRYDNNPENLTYMSYWDHTKYHQSIAAEKNKIIREQHPERWAAYISKLSNSIKTHIANLSPEEKEARDEMCREKFLKGNKVLREMLASDPKYNAWFGQQISVGQKQSKINNPEVWQARDQAILENNTKMWADPNHRARVFKNQTLKFDQKLFDIMKTTYLETEFGSGNIPTILGKLLTDNKIFMDHYRYLNKETNAPNMDLTKFTGRNLCLMLNQFGYKKWKDFSNECYDLGLKIKKRLSQTKFDHYLLKQVHAEYEKGEKVASRIIKKLQGNEEFITRFRELNSGNKKVGNFMWSTFSHLLNWAGYKNFDDYKAKKHLSNHKLVSIEWLEEKVDTGCITVDWQGEYHNYHNFGLSIEILTKNSLGEVDDLKYFNNKLLRGLRVPPSYVPSGPDEGAQQFSDGRVGTAYMQELAFSEYCQRLQRAVSHVFDDEFKLFMTLKGIEIESDVFELSFKIPENFAKYRQIELDSAQLALIANLFDVPFISKRFVMERYMNLTPEEMLYNQELWSEENATLVKNKKQPEATQGAEGLGAVGVSSGGNSGFDMGGGLPPPETGGEELSATPPVETGGTEAPAAPEPATGELT